MWFITLLGKISISIFDNINDVLVFLAKVFVAAITPPFYLQRVCKQLLIIGFYSLPIVSFTALFAGMVLALQSYSGFSRFSAESAIASVVVISIVRELGPVFTGLMVAGRIGASICAEIGTMKVSEQIDALKVMGVNPLKYLIAPKVLASMIAMPILVIVANIIGVFGGFIVAAGKLGFNPVNYMEKTFQYFEMQDLTLGLTKALVFGIIVSIIGSYQGYHTKNGAEGVGRSTTNAVVISSIMILLFNYILTELFFMK
ncbi:MAG: ABC transporter permease [Rickettsiales bacterium]|jgi:phospholipid/cholesterol/gamma-HCH transport system permease protein|nr:ABC transporter permease [Rickettsiales bacterium]